MMDSGDHHMTQSRTCLGCFVETEDTTEPRPKPETQPWPHQDYHGCPVSGLPMKCRSYGDKLHYGGQLLPVQILSSEKAEEGQSDSENDSEDIRNKNIFESLFLDTCSDEEPLLTNTSQDWGCFESFISESKIELLDLCSKNELSVNLFSEDEDNYMFDDEEEDSTLDTNVCSLKIRYESFQDNVRQKTNANQEDAKVNFFPRADSKNGSNRPYDDGSNVKVFPAEGNINQIISGSAQEKQSVIQRSSNILDSGENSDGSSCTGSSLDTCQIKRKHQFLSRENSSFSCQLSYGLRSKRKGRYSEDYLYDVDSLENEKSIEKKEEKGKQKVGRRKERDDDWCPKKKRKYHLREPPVVIKYAITNRFKGEKHMLVKLLKLDRFEKTVSLNEDLVNKYKRLSPLKDYWEIKRKAMQEQCKLFTTDQNKYLNGRRRSHNSSSPRQKNRSANRVKIQRIHAVTPLLNSSIDVSVELVPANTDIEVEKTLHPNCASMLTQGIVTNISRSQMWKEARQGSKSVKLHKFKSEARLRSLKVRRIGVDKTKIGAQEVIPIAFRQNLSTDNSIAGSTKITSRTNVIVTPATCNNNMKESVNVNSTLSVFAGGYLRSLLDGTDSLSSLDISYYPQKKHSMQPSHDPSQEDSPFRNIQLAQGSVPSRPSALKLKPSPSNCTDLLEPGISHVWQSDTDTLSFEQDIAPSSTGMNVGFASQMQESECSQVNLNNTRLQVTVESTLTCKIAADNRHLALNRATLSSDNGRLVHCDSVNQLSATTDSYSSFGLLSGEKDNEHEVDKNYCNPKLVVQPSGYEIVLPRESTDLLDISNFTPDKFRHSLVSEMSPSITPREPERRESLGKQEEIPKTSDVRWESSITSQQNTHVRAGNNHHFQFHSSHCEDHKAANISTEMNEDVESEARSVKVHKSKRKNTTRHNPGQGQDSVGERRGIKKDKAPRVAKTENTKPQKTSCASQKIKSLFNAKIADKMHSNAASKECSGHTEDWPLMQERVGIWLDSNCKNPVKDSHREFDEPSNILSNIVSGMAEVQKFMKVSMAPLWDPMTRLGSFSTANSLNKKTIKILAGTTSVLKKNAGSRKKVAGKEANIAEKFIPSEPFFPSVFLDGGMFHTPNPSFPGTCRAAHKKIYRHKASAKFACEGNKGKTDLGREHSSINGLQ